MSKREAEVRTQDGARLYVETRGSGGEVVLVPNGLYFAEALAPLAEDRTLVWYDLRNRGRSDVEADPARLARGVLQDLDDLEDVRRSLGAERVDLIAHSYVAVTAFLYARDHPERVRRVVQIGPPPPDPDTRYPPDQTHDDGVLQQTFARIAQLRQEPSPEDPEQRCRRFWSVLGAIYVADPADAARADFGRCEHANERGFMGYFTGSVQPSLQRLNLGAADFAKVSAPFLVVHGRLDRSAPWGAGREWARRLPEARLLTVPEAAHAPWIEAPERFAGAIARFLDGEWPPGAEPVTEA